MSDVDEIKKRANEDIVEIVSQYVSLQRVGSQYKSLCPFHSEKTPSFFVTPGKGFKCFGCGKGGDAVKFLMEIEGISYAEAIERLATRYGITIKTTRRQSPTLQVLSKVQNIFHETIKANTQIAKAGREYLRERGIKSETVKEWGIGIGIDLSRILSKEELDLLPFSPRFFLNRITFPIFKRGQVVGFVGRIIPPLEREGTPKYLISPNHKYFEKSKILFGDWGIPKGVRKVFLTEGVFDVIIPSQLGFSAVAPLGAHLTPSQAHLLKVKGIREVVLVLDNDVAGRNAIYNTALTLAKEGIISLIPPTFYKSEYKDLADYVLGEGYKATRTLLTQNVDYVIFLIHKLKKSEDPLHFEEFYGKVTTLIKAFPYPLREFYFSKFYSLLKGRGERWSGRKKETSSTITSTLKEKLKRVILQLERLVKEWIEMGCSPLSAEEIVDIALIIPKAEKLLECKKCEAFESEWAKIALIVKRLALAESVLQMGKAEDTEMLTLFFKIKDAIELNKIKKFIKTWESLKKELKT